MLLTHTIHNTNNLMIKERGMTSKNQLLYHHLSLQGICPSKCSITRNRTIYMRLEITNKTERYNLIVNNGLERVIA